MKNNVSFEPNMVVDTPIYDLQKLLDEVQDMVEERRAIEDTTEE